MGVGFTIDSAVKIAHLGIDSVLSLNGQPLQEKMREFYCKKNHLKYEKINEKEEDFRAKRTTAFLNTINDLVKKKIESFLASPVQKKEEILECISLLPDSAKLKSEFLQLLNKQGDKKAIRQWISTNLHVGSIDVNIMTKLDRVNYEKGKPLPTEQNDAHAALRGFAKSELESSLVLSAGLNPRLFSYMEQFEDFYPDEDGYIKKKIILKVSDYRSALVQGKFLAMKGIWISEYRIESGLNCGGHAFATEGFLMGPILEEFKNQRENLYDTVFETLKTALETKNLAIPKNKLPFKFSAQGGVGTSEEHSFLLDYYKLDSIGWGSPFLLVPEVTNVDDNTMNLLIDAEEKDFYLSHISPIGVRFNSVKGTSKEIEREERISNMKPGSPCVEGNLALFNTEFSDKPLCLAARKYQDRKIKELKKQNLEASDFFKEYNKVVDKTCLCTGLINSVLIVNNLKTQKGNSGVSICPGPNMFYFKEVRTLKQMADHIYGRKDISFPQYRPHMFIKELKAYIDYLGELVQDFDASSKKEHNRLLGFSSNLITGVNYYEELFSNQPTFTPNKSLLTKELAEAVNRIQKLQAKISQLTAA